MGDFIKERAGTAKRPRITSREMAEFLKRAIERAGDQINENVRISKIDEIDEYHRVRFYATDGSIVTLDPEWLVPRGYYDDGDQ